MRINKKLLAIALLVGLTQSGFSTELGDENPAGVSGIYNGNSSTGGNYDPFTGNAMRGPIDDISVPSAVGAYPLKWTRFFNSHVTWGDNEMGGSWRFS